MFKISVIVPTFNDEEYLNECIEHIIKQDIGFENIQLIIIDDHSTDNSYQIAMEYAKKYPDNIIVAKTDKNSNSGGRPRNIGIKHAKGKYLMFSDADDYFSYDAFKIMYNQIEKEQADILIANWNYMSEDGIPWEKPVFDKKRFKKFKLSLNDYNSFWVMNSSMCNKIFNREFIANNKIKCLEGLPGEDTYFSMNSFLCANKIYYIPDIIYYYRQRNTKNKSSSTSWNCSKEFFIGMNKAYKKTYMLFAEKGQLQFYRFLYARNMTYLLYRFIDSTQLSDEDRIELMGKMKWFFKLSHTLNVSACQKSLMILIDIIIKGKYNEALDICKIIAEMRSFMDVDVRHSMSKPYEEMYKEILDNPLKEA